MPAMSNRCVSLGLANAKPPAPWASLDERDVDTAEHRKLAKDAAMQGFVLLKNEEKKGTLLLDVAAADVHHHQPAEHMLCVTVQRVKRE